MGAYPWRNTLITVKHTQTFKIIGTHGDAAWKTCCMKCLSKEVYMQGTVRSVNYKTNLKRIHVKVVKGETRWNFLHDCLQQIYDIHDNWFKDNDILDSNEHLSCVAVLAEALDILQGEKDVLWNCSSMFIIFAAKVTTFATQRINVL